MAILDSAGILALQKLIDWYFSNQIFTICVFVSNAKTKPGLMSCLVIIYHSVDVPVHLPCEIANFSFCLGNYERKSNKNKM